MEVNYLIIEFMEKFPILLIILLGFLGTETILLLTFISATQNGIISFWTLFLIGFLIILLLDTLYYKIGKIKFLRNLIPNKLRERKYKNIISNIKKITHENIFTILFMSKFVYGFRQMIIVYLGYSNYPYKKFFKKDFFALLLYLTIMMTLTWTIGYSAGASFEIVKDIEKSILLGILFLGVLLITFNYVAKKILKVK